jgi:hypothetical protein
MLAEKNARQGFFEDEQREAVLAHLPGALRSVVSSRQSVGGAFRVRSWSSNGTRSASTNGSRRSRRFRA